jgi:DNA topoisomerase-1
MQAVSAQNRSCDKTSPVTRRFSTRGGLRYVNDDDLKIRRTRSRHGFRYLNSKGGVIRDARVTGRINHLAIPPAWQEVRISRDPRGHIQAVGQDAKGRKQYLYHERWSDLRSESKFDRLQLFGKVLPKIRRAVARDLRRPKLPREKVLAALVQLLELSAARIGNEQYVNENKSYGLSTLRNQHASVSGPTIHLKFRGKTGKVHELDFRHPTLAKIIRKCQHLPGQKLFEYIDDQGVHAIRSDDVNAYLSEVSGESITTKDFRTWKATVLVVRLLGRVNDSDPKPTSKNVNGVIREVARRLGNTAAICRKSYVHPAVTECYLNGGFSALSGGASESIQRLRSEEQMVLRLLKRKRYDGK